MILARALVVVTVTVTCVAGCQRERRDFQTPPSGAVAIQSLRMTVLTPGALSLAPANPDPLEENAYALSEGKRLFHWYNCSGCHAEGGGAIGPALMDDVWIYGSDPANVFATIVQGRPNGMPSYGGRVPEREVWELVAYVRSLSGLAKPTAATSRDDSINVKPAENRMDKGKPVQATPSGASEHP